MTDNSREVVGEFDGIRGLAIAMVLMFHLGHGVLTVEPGSALAYLLVPLRMLWAGVDLFFVLSGFLICGILIRERNSSGYFPVFYGRRALRILPLYGLLLLLFLLGVALQQHGVVDAPRLFAESAGWGWYLVFGQNFHQAFGLGQINFLSVSWSLAVEEQMYLLLPLLVWWSRRHLGWLAVLFVALVLSAVLARALIAAQVPADDAERICYVLPWTRWDAFGVGGLLALAAYRWPLAARPAWRTPAWIGLLTGLAGMAVVAHGEHLGQQRFIPIVLAFGSLLLLALVLDPGHWLRRLLRLRPLRWLGKVSYGLYLWHIPILGVYLWAAGLPEQPLVSVRPGWITLAATLTTLLVAWASFRWFEAPLLQWGRRRWRYGHPVAVSPAS